MFTYKHMSHIWKVIKVWQWEMLIYSKTTKPKPHPVPGIDLKSWPKLLGMKTLAAGWQPKASTRLYILRVCKFCSYSQDQLNKLFDSLILSFFAYSLEVWVSACQKYLGGIDNFCKWTYWYGNIPPSLTTRYTVWISIEEKDQLLFKKKTIHLKICCCYNWQEYQGKGGMNSNSPR